MADITNKALQRAVTALETKVGRNADALAAQAREIENDATDTHRVAEQIAAKNVDRDTVSEAHDLGKITSGLSTAVLDYAAAGQDTARSARAAGDQARASHDGIDEALSRSTVTGIYDVDADWFAQE
jgi:hypothetical protein